MTLVGKLEADVEIDVPAVEFHDVFGCRPHHVSNMSPDRIHGCDLHEDIMKEYKSYKATVQATSKGNGSLVYWTLKYEKLNENIPDPHTLMEFLIHCT
ncbi:hypothetical protein MANES_17G078850v8 [Manihot esculenta]|uniref:Uncharacterized protein n=1 Tax=Manihot esculenta TaxID=3983 RepID=A0ACB7G4U6_MANES|nr:hypothetical protein MANES_17G078850v8 [Manihot esculenta]